MTARIESIFLGVTPTQFRKYLGYVFDKHQNNYEKFVLPAAGTLSDVKTALHHGFKPENIYASDMGLYSSVLGYMMSGQDLDDLEVEILDEELKWLEDYFGTDQHAASLMFLIKLSQLDESTYYEYQFTRDMKERADRYIDRLDEDLESYKKISGIHYEIRDMWEVIHEAKTDPDTFLHVAPPGYTGGYKKMFPNAGIYTWLDPMIEEFDPEEEFDDLFEALVDEAEAFTTLQVPKGEETTPEEYVKNVAFGAQRSSQGRFDYLVTNHPDRLKKWIDVKSRTDIEACDYPQLPEDHEITRDSTIRFEKIKEAEGMYYRDLWAHRLGATKSERHYAHLVDGYLVSVCGIHMQKFHLRRKDWIHETYGFSVPSDEYPWLNKLLMRSLITNSFKDFIMGEETFLLYEPKGLKTVCLSQYPELKTNRGILDLIEREKWDNNQYHLEYYADFPEDFDYDDALNWWMDKREARIEREAKSG